MNNTTTPRLSPPTPAPMWPALWAVWSREMVRFARQRSRVVGALVTPLLFWVLLGFGADRAFDPGRGGGDVGYLAYFFPGALVMILLFTAIFSTISVIEDRREGFLQGVLVSPAPRVAVVLGKVLGGASIATAQGLVFLLLFPLVSDDWPGLGMYLAAAVMMPVVAIGLTGLGLVLAWPMDSTAGYHAMMNILLMPMWFLSGAVFPVETAPGWMRIVMAVNPLTYGHQTLAGLLLGDGAGETLLPLWACAAISVGFALVMIGWATRLASKPA
ncbi:MAG: ABC transporter permease [Phycisphaerales bacterium JB063]